MHTAWQRGNRASSAQAGEPRENAKGSGASGHEPRKNGHDPPTQSRASQSALSAQARVVSPETTSRHRARARESSTNPRKQARGAVDREAQHRRRDTRGCSWAPRQLRARGAPKSTLNFPPHGAFGGFAQATTALVASAPTSTSGVGRLGDSGCSDRGRQGEAVGVEEGIPVAVRVGRDVWRSLRGLNQACRAAGSVARGSRRARSRLQCARGAREAELSGRDWWAALDGQARNQSRLSESDRATRRDSADAGAAPRSSLRQRRWRARAWRTRSDTPWQLRRRRWKLRSRQSLRCS